MGIVNLTPDSFSDAGAIRGVDAAMEATRQMVDAGAAIIDIGGESTRPGAESVAAHDEIVRILPFLREAVDEFDVPLCVDTRKAPVAAVALDAGASAVNDVSGLRYDPDLGPVVARAGAGMVLMHMRGQPATMNAMTDYGDLLGEVRIELAASVAAAVSAGVDPESIVLDPGIGFAKTATQSLTLLRDLDSFAELGFPLLVGPSRKSFLGAVLGVPPDDRLEGTIAACVAAYLGGARLFRVHDVAPVVKALSVARAIVSPGVVE